MVTALAGVALVGIPSVAEPHWARAAAIAGLIAVAAALRPRWAAAGMAAAAAAIAQCAVSSLNDAALAGEGLLLLAYLLLLDVPEGLQTAAARKWLRLRTPAALAGLAVVVVVLAALAVTPSASAWIAIAGLAAAAIAYLTAMPRRADRAPSDNGKTGQ
jgi:hypothetical protein